MLFYVLLATVLCVASALSAQTPATPLVPDPPLSTWQDHWDRYVERTYSWKRVALTGADTLLDEAFDAHRCGRPPYCLPHRYGAALAQRTTRTTIELGMGALLHEDSRRTRSNLPGVRPRLLYAMKDALRARTSDGHWRPAYGRFTGSLGGIVVSRVALGRPLTTGRVAEAFGWSIADNFPDALLHEFGPDLQHTGLRMAHRVLQFWPAPGRGTIAARP